MSHHTPLSKLAEIDANLEYFLRELPKLMERHAGEYALLRHRAVIGFYASPGDAQIAGNDSFPDGIFSFQKVTETAERGR